MKRLLALCVSLIAIAFPSVSAAGQQSVSANAASIRRFFQEFNDRQATGESAAYRAEVRRTTRYIAAFPQLHGSDTTAIVYLESVGDTHYWCGTGGCPTFVLKKYGAEWRIVSRILATRPPIYVLPETSDGWHDIAVLVCGGGIIKCYESDVPFDGKSYALNPSMPPGHKLEHVSGISVIKSFAQAIPLF